jgi:hypothetical protein
VHVDFQYQAQTIGRKYRTSLFHGTKGTHGTIATRKSLLYIENFQKPSEFYQILRHSTYTQVLRARRFSVPGTDYR